MTRRYGVVSPGFANVNSYIREQNEFKRIHKEVLEVLGSFYQENILGFALLDGLHPLP